MKYNRRTIGSDLVCIAKSTAGRMESKRVEKENMKRFRHGHGVADKVTLQRPGIPLHKLETPEEAHAGFSRKMTMALTQSNWGRV